MEGEILFRAAINMKYLGMTLMRNVQEKYKILLKKYFKILYRVE